MTLSPARMVSQLLAWPARSQAVACRNARVASAALAERRREHVEVEEFLATLAAADATPPAAAAG